jgi:hypothetical protein
MGFGAGQVLAVLKEVQIDGELLRMEALRDASAATRVARSLLGRAQRLAKGDLKAHPIRFQYQPTDVVGEAALLLTQCHLFQ